jgi:hypothetical protein
VYTQILVPEIMASMVPKGFPADQLSKPEYKVKADKDVISVPSITPHVIAQQCGYAMPTRSAFP